MLSRTFTVQTATTLLPSLVLSLMLVFAGIAGMRYWDKAQQADILVTDRFNLSHLDSEIQRQRYREYRQHQVSPEAAVRWVKEERELTDLKRLIDRQDHTAQTSLRPRTLREYGDSIPLGRTVSY
jgi:hypothetical protein